MTPPTVRQALAQSGLVPVDAQVLLAHVLGRDRAWLIAHAGDPISHESADASCARPAPPRRRARRLPDRMARVLGPAARRRRLRVLIPRPETETLVEVALARLPADRASRVLDLGTGSGAIALSLASERPQALIVATDTSQAALAVARDNAQRLGIANVAFAQGDWFDGCSPGDERFDLIASNPPYVAADDAHLREGDLPLRAERRARGGRRRPRRAARDRRGRAARLARADLVVEHGYDQSDAVQRLFADAGLEGIVRARDLAGIPRVVAGRRR